MALGYGVMAALILLLVGVFTGHYLKAIRLRQLALCVAGITAVVLGIFAMQTMTRLAENTDSDSAYEAAGSFNVVMQRLDDSDPYLFTKMEVDTASRHWTMTGPAPEYQICTGLIRANTLMDIRQALDQLARMDSARFAECHNSPDSAIKRLSWHLNDDAGQRQAQNTPYLDRGELDITSNCASAVDEVRRVLLGVESVSLTTSSRVKCQ